MLCHSLRKKGKIRAYSLGETFRVEQALHNIFAEALEAIPALGRDDCVARIYAHGIR